MLSHDEARFSRLPALRPPLGLTGQRPVVGHRDWQGLAYRFGALTRVTGQRTTRLAERRTAHERGRKPRSGPRRVQAALARHVRDIARAYPAGQHPRVVRSSDKAPWPQGPLGTAALKVVPHLERCRFPSDSPQLQVIERFWKVWRRRAPHKRLFPALTRLKQALRNSLCSDQPLKHRVRSRLKASKKRTKVSVA